MSQLTNLFARGLIMRTMNDSKRQKQQQIEVGDCQQKIHVEHPLTRTHTMYINHIIILWILSGIESTADTHSAHYREIRKRSY